MCSLHLQHSNTRAEFFCKIIPEKLLIFSSIHLARHKEQLQRNSFISAQLIRCCALVSGLKMMQLLSKTNEHKMTGKTIRNMGSCMGTKISHVWDLDKVRVRFNLRSYFDSPVILFDANNLVCDIPMLTLAHTVRLLE